MKVWVSYHIKFLRVAARIISSFNDVLEHSIRRQEIKENWNRTPEKMEILQEGADLFGALLIDGSLEFEGYRIWPKDNLKGRLEYLREARHRDKYVYPPIIQSWTSDILGEGNNHPKIIPNTLRPAKLHRPVSTHHIARIDGTALSEDFRTNDGALILRFLEVLQETQLQFYTWWWAGRVRLDDSPHPRMTLRQLEVALSKALITWASWTDKEKNIYLNCCFHYSRSLSYEWDYEEFVALYMCIDTIWFFCAKKNGLGYVPHAKRVNKVVEILNLWSNPEEVKNIVELRNMLFHEGSWGDGSPMSSKSFEKLFHAKRCLREVCHRALLALSGQTNSYVFSRWEGYRSSHPWEMAPVSLS